MANASFKDAEKFRAIVLFLRQHHVPTWAQLSSRLRSSIGFPVAVIICHDAVRGSCCVPNFDPAEERRASTNLLEQDAQTGEVEVGNT